MEFVYLNNRNQQKKTEDNFFNLIILLKKNGLEPYYQNERFVLYLGDALKILKKIPEKTIDLIFADPPYNLSNGGFTVYAGKRASVNKGDWDKSKGLKNDWKFHLSWISEAKNTLKDNGAIWISGTYHSIYQCGFALQVCGYHILNDIAWFKPSAPPNLSCRFFTASHETLIWARKDKKGKHFFNYKLAKEGIWKEDFLKRSGKQMRSVWAIGAPKSIEKIFGKHPTQKPLDLLNRIILLTSKKDDIILDPFTGSSTTGISAYLNSRNFIGIDLEKKYLDLSIKRYEFLKNNFKKNQLKI